MTLELPLCYSCVKTVWEDNVRKGTLTETRSAIVGCEQDRRQDKDRPTGYSRFSLRRQPILFMQRSMYSCRINFMPP